MEERKKERTRDAVTAPTGSTACCGGNSRHSRLGPSESAIGLCLPTGATAARRPRLPGSGRQPADSTAPASGPQSHRLWPSWGSASHLATGHLEDASLGELAWGEVLQHMATAQRPCRLWATRPAVLAERQAIYDTLDAARIGPAEAHNGQWKALGDWALAITDTALAVELGLREPQPGAYGYPAIDVLWEEALAGARATCAGCGLHAAHLFHDPRRAGGVGTRR